MVDKNSVELEVFVSQAIRQILDGVKQAADHAASFDNKYGEVQVGYGDMKQEYKSFHQYNTSIDFDIMVTSTVDKSDKTGVKIKIGIVDFGLGGGKDHSDGNTNRIKFSVPISYPSLNNE